MLRMHEELINAIHLHHRIQFIYNGVLRIGEPQCYGVGNKGTTLLRVYVLQGSSQPEPLFDVSKIKDLVLLDTFFTKPGPNYKKGDSAMKVIYAEL
jgi:hypothetical protein